MEAIQVKITKGGESEMWDVFGVVRSGSRGKEYQLGKPGDSHIHRVCYAPEYITGDGSTLTTCGETLSYYY